MQKYKFLIFIGLFILSVKCVSADEYAYKPAFSDSVLINGIHSLVYDDQKDLLYINGLSTNKISNYNFVYFEDQNEITFTYDPKTEKIKVSYLKPQGNYYDILAKIITNKNITSLYINDGITSKYYPGILKENKIEFGNISFNNNLNQSETFFVYLDLISDKVVFQGKETYNFKIEQKPDTELKIVLSGKTDSNKAYAINDPMNLDSALNGAIDDERINFYLQKYSVELFNSEFSISKNVNLKKMMDKWENISLDSYRKEDVIVACTNKDKECEVYPKSAYLINDYLYTDILEDRNNLIDGSSKTPVELRVYDSPYLYSETLKEMENLEVIKQERDVIKEFNNWSEYKNEPCEDSTDKKCRYKTFYTKYTYNLISSTPVYSGFILQKELLENPIETTDFEYTEGPYLNCTKYEETEVVHNTTKCLARDDTENLYAVQCKGDSSYSKLCMAETNVTKNSVLKLEPVNEENREYCKVCTVNRTYPINVDEQGRKYVKISVLGSQKTTYIPDGNCTNIQNETYTEIVRGQCLQRAMLYNHYKKEYLYDDNVYSKTPIVQENLESCEEAENKEEGKVVCEKEIKSSFSNAEYRYSDWVDVNEFSNLKDKERRYKYRSFKTYGTKQVIKIIEKGEYTSKEALSFIKDVAAAKTRVLTNEREYYLLKESEKTDDFKALLEENIISVKAKELFAPVIHVLEKDINSLENVSFKNYEGSKELGQYFLGTYIPIQEDVFKEVTKELEKNVVYFESTQKLKEYDNWKDEEELMEIIDNADLNNSEFEITLNRDDIKRLKNWRYNKNQNVNCELIRDFSNVVTKPSNFNELLIKTSGCEIKE